MRLLVQRISQECIERHLLEEDEREVYEYFLGLAVSFVFNIFLVMSMGIAFGKPVHTVLFLLGLILIRFTGGGYHTKSSIVCFVVSIAFFLVCFTLCSLPLSDTTYRISGSVMAVLGVGAVFASAPVAHPNAPMDEWVLKRNKRRCRWLSSVWNAWCVILLWIIDDQNVTIPFMGLTGIFVASMLLIIARRLYYGKQNFGNVGKGLCEESAGED